jgi:hypothetical protein
MTNEFFWGPNFRTVAATKIGKELDFFSFFLLKNRNNAPKWKKNRKI